MWNHVVHHVDEIEQNEKTLSYDYRPFNGENVDQVRARVQVFLNELTDRYTQENIACVTHGGILRLLYDEFSVKQPDHIGNTSVHTFKIS